MEQSYAVGQSWVYEAPRGFEKSRIIIGAILTFATHEPVICTAVTQAPMLDANGNVQPLTIPFLPFSKTAFDQTVVDIDGSAKLPEDFKSHYTSWKNHQNGLGFIDIPFKGLLRTMVEDLHEKTRQTQNTVTNIAHINNH